MSERIPMKVSPNEVVLEELRDFDNAAIRKTLEDFDVVKSGNEITVEDYAADRNRAAILAGERNVPVSTKALLAAAFIDRMRYAHADQFSNEAIKELPQETLRAFIYAETGINL